MTAHPTSVPSPFSQLMQARDLLLACRQDPARAYAEFAWPAFCAEGAPAVSFNWALDWFDCIARDNPRTALWVVRDVRDGATDERRSYAELSARSSRLANYLRRCGVRRGDRVLLMLPGIIALWESLLAAAKLGAVVVPATTQLTATELVARIERGAIRHLITDAAGAERCASVPQGVTRFLTGDTRPGWLPIEECHTESDVLLADGVTRPSDPLLLYFTSGTTALPKLVLHTHASYPVGHLSTMYWLGLQPGDVHYNVSSPGWAKHAWSCVFAPFLAGATVLAHSYARFSGAETLALLRRCGVTTLCAPPTVWRMLLLEELGTRPGALRELASAGEPLNPEIIERVRAAWDLTIRDGFGQTETTALVGNPPGQPVRPGSMGRPLPGYHVTLLGLDGKPVPEGPGEGEVAVALTPRPVGVMVGYQDDVMRTAAAMAGGYYRTGDEAVRDGDGYFHYVGRGDDIFKSSDYRISPFELESALLEHPSVAEAAVVPSPDPLRLSVPKAFVVLKPHVQPGREAARALLGFLRTRLAPYQRVRRIEFAELPKTISGKIRRVALRQLERERAEAGSRGPQEFRIEDFAAETGEAEGVP